VYSFVERSLKRELCLLLAGAVTTLTLLPSPSTASAAVLPTASADVKFQSVTVTWMNTELSVVSLTQIAVQNDNDDDAQSVRLVLTLPLQSRVLTASAGAQYGPTYSDPNTPWPVLGNLQFDLENIPVSKTATVWLKTETMYSALPNAYIGVFVFSAVPDPNPASNFRTISVLN
jgi:hypothetical protein